MPVINAPHRNARLVIRLNGREMDLVRQAAGVEYLGVSEFARGVIVAASKGVTAAVVPPPCRPSTDQA